MAQEPWTAERVREMMTNPIYCLSEPAIVAEDVWIAAGVKLIRARIGLQCVPNRQVRIEPHARHQAECQTVCHQS